MTSGNSKEAECKESECPGEQGWELGYGMAGGGIGAYYYCPKCDKIVDKWQDPEMMEDHDD